MYYALIVVVIIGVVVYACLKKKRGNTEKPKEKNPDNDGNHTEITVNVPTESKGYIVEDGIKKEVTIRYMPQGLQVFDENGVCVLDVTTSLCRVIGGETLTADHGSITVSAPGTVWAAVFSEDEVLNTYPVSVTISGNVIHWQYKDTSIVNGIYGVQMERSAKIIYGTY